jgi:prephenate dehydrogenase
MNTVRCVTIVGVGLIGGSIGLALRRRDGALRVVGYGSRPATLASAHKIGAISEIATDARQAVADSDLVVVCAPVDHIVEQVEQLAQHCRPGTLITDAGSTKRTIVAELTEAAAGPNWPAEVRFIGSHPLAGNEKKGPQHASADLFDGRTVLITPTSASHTADVRRLNEFWSGLGATVREMSAEEHDQALAATSHLPHLAAAAIAGATPEQYVTLTAGGWQDTTRIAAGDPALWRQIMLANRENLLAALAQLSTSLDKWRHALEAQDGAELERLLAEAKRIRDAVGS